MQPEFVILSRTAAESYEPRGEREVCISVVNPNSPVVHLSSRFRAVLRLAFTDIAKPSPMPFDLLFSSTHAEAILNFLAKWPDVERIVIHCVGGQGRSPAIAMGISELHGLPTHALEACYPFWNTWVRSELVRVGRMGTEHSE